MVDFAAGHITSEQSHPIVAALDAALGGGRDGVRFHPGVEYRHLCVVPARLGRRRVRAAARPHRPAAVLPDRAGGGEARRADGRVARRSCATRPRRSGSSRDADLAVGSGRAPGAAGVRRERFGVTGRLTSAVDLVRGLGVLTGIEVRRRPGRDRRLRQRLRARSATRASTSLADRDLFLLHVEATDEAGHQGDVEREGRRARAVGRRDHRARSSTRSTDERVPGAAHARPRDAVRAACTHTSDPVPYLLFDSDADGPGRRVHRVAASPAPQPVVAHELMAPPRSPDRSAEGAASDAWMVAAPGRGRYTGRRPAASVRHSPALRQGIRRERRSRRECTDAACRSLPLPAPVEQRSDWQSGLPRTPPARHRSVPEERTRQ